MGIPELLAVWLSCLVANIICIFLIKETWRIALDRTWFQGIPLLIVWFTAWWQS